MVAVAGLIFLWYGYKQINKFCSQKKAYLHYNFSGALQHRAPALYQKYLLEKMRIFRMLSGVKLKTREARLKWL